MRIEQYFIVHGIWFVTANVRVRSDSDWRLSDCYAMKSHNDGDNRQDSNRAN
jgi:hypothetical protein